MHVIEVGAEAGTPIVFLHGAMVASWMWLGQTEGLPEYRCLLPDLPGMGRSGGEPWIGLADTADQVAEIIRSRCSDQRAHIVGLSLGGLVGLNVAVRHSKAVSSLVVSGVPHGPTPLPLRMLSRAMLALYGNARGAGLVARLLGIPDDESRAAFVETAQSTNPAALRAVMDEVFVNPLPDGLDGATTPTLAVVGTKDTTVARRAVGHLQKCMPDARGCLVPDVGHQWNAEQPVLFTDMVRAWVEALDVDPRLTPIGS